MQVGSYAIALALLDTEECDFNQKDSKGVCFFINNTALHWAVAKGQLEIVRKLLESEDLTVSCRNSAVYFWVYWVFVLFL
jgi:ankyrin repeat protein